MTASTDSRRLSGEHSSTSSTLGIEVRLFLRAASSVDIQDLDGFVRKDGTEETLK